MNFTRSDLDLSFTLERLRFGQRYPKAIATQWRFTNGRCTLPGKCGFRDLAYAEPNSNVITLHRRILTMPVANVIALIRHEFGHIVDTRFMQPGAEQRADNLAEDVTGQKIYYDDNDVQTLVRGKYPRPRYLHR